MKAMILAAGLGTRLRPWTEHHPKAFVPVKGVPMLERVIVKLRGEGFDMIVVNVHHFADQIRDFLSSRDFGVRIAVSDESGCLLDTGGGLVKAKNLLDPEAGPVLVHNVDILSDASLRTLVEKHEASHDVATLLVSDRVSERKLVFDGDMALRGWHNLKDGRYRPEGFVASEDLREYAFSGIHVVGAEMLREMESLLGTGSFPVMDYYLSARRQGRVGGWVQRGLRLIDIGKPATLSQADAVLDGLEG